MFFSKYCNVHQLFIDIVADNYLFKDNGMEHILLGKVKHLLYNYTNIKNMYFINDICSYHFLV